MPITKEQLSQIEEYVKTLPENEREQKMKEIISQFENPQCPFCLMSEGKIETTKVYEDENFLAVLEIKPASPGHIILMVKKHISQISKLSSEDFENIARIIKKLSYSLSKTYGSFNILISEGENSGQRFDHVTINLIPRFKEDNISISWNPLKLEQKDLEKIKEKIIKNFPQAEKPKQVEINKEHFEEELKKLNKRLP